MANTFNIRNKDWDSSYSYYLAHNDILTDVADSFELILSFSIQ